MPNVRASSGMIGTQREPNSLSFIRSLRSRTKAIVVAIFCLPLPRLMSPNAFESGIFRALALVRRDGIEPPSSRRRSSMYWISSDLSPGW